MIAGVGLVALSGWLVLDPLVALAVALHILWTGVRLVRRAITGLLDVAIPEEERNDIDKILAEYTKRYGVAFHAVRTRHAVITSYSIHYTKLYESGVGPARSDAR